MSNLEQNALDNAFRIWRQERMENEKEDKAFEIFALEQILKDNDLSDDEIAHGNVGAGGDGGIDGFFFFVDRQLVREDNFSPTAAIGAELTLIQATRTAGFAETRIDKLENFCRYLLEWQNLDGQTNLNQPVKENMLRFRRVYEQMLTHSHTLTVNLHYASRSNHAPAANLILRVEQLKKYIKSKLSLATVTFTPWGSAALLESVRSNPQKRLILEKVKDLSMPDGSIVCLCTVASFASFLDDGHGKLRAWIMEPNVRDYQGNNQVNKQIRATLNSANWPEDFWWLNNGITILSDSCTITGDRATIENPEIVNGLQTSYEIFNARANEALKRQHVLVKVIVAQEDRAKNAIIKATNTQTPVSAVSLKATDPIQFDIEDRLKLVGLFYDRRKGKYRRLKKPINSIVSITALGQAIIAAYLQRPSDSRARPQTVLNDEKSALQVFSGDHPLDFYAACILIDRRCADFVTVQQSLRDEEKVDLRYYVTMLVTCQLCGKAQPTAADIATALPLIASNVNDLLLSECLNTANAVYKEKGGTDKVAKGRDMEDELKRDIAAAYSGR